MEFLKFQKVNDLQDCGILGSTIHERRPLDILRKRELIDIKNESLEFLREMRGRINRRKPSFGTREHRSKGSLEYVHSDVWGPTSVETIGGARYLIFFIDDYSQKYWIYLMKIKDQVFEKF